MYTYVHSYTYIHFHTYMHNYIHVHTCIYTQIHAYTPSYIDIRVHTFTGSCMYINGQPINQVHWSFLVFGNLIRWSVVVFFHSRLICSCFFFLYYKRLVLIDLFLKQLLQLNMDCISLTLPVWQLTKICSTFQTGKAILQSGETCVLWEKVMALCRSLLLLWGGHQNPIPSMLGKLSLIIMKTLSVTYH